MGEQDFDAYEEFIKIPEKRIGKFNDAWSFIGDMYKSPGFEQRYRRHYASIPEGTIPKYEDLPDLPIYPKVRNAGAGPENFNEQTGIISIRDFDNLDFDKRMLQRQRESDQNLFEPLWDADAQDTHELGHFLGNLISQASLKKQEPLTFKESDTYDNSYESLKNKKLTENYPSYTDLPLDEYVKLYNQSHDYFNSEQGADIRAMQYMLKKLGIRDLTKKDNPVTQEDVEQFIKLYPNFRLTNNNSIDDVINMLNTYAYNNQNINNNIYYAKRGRKLVPKSKFVKIINGNNF